MTEREKRKQESNRQAMRMVVLILQLGVTMMTCIFLCGLIGKAVADAFRRPALFPLLLIPGILAGFRACYQLIKRFTSFENPEDAGLAFRNPDDPAADWYPREKSGDETAVKQVPEGQSGNEPAKEQDTEG